MIYYLKKSINNMIKQLLFIVNKFVWAFRSSIKKKIFL